MLSLLDSWWGYRRDPRQLRDFWLVVRICGATQIHHAHRTIIIHLISDYHAVSCCISFGVTTPFYFFSEKFLLASS